MSLYNRIIIPALTVFLSLNSLFSLKTSAQGLGNSPYSSLGVGEFYGDGFSDNSGMGQSGVSTASGFQLNNLNPALWTRNKFTTLDIGLIGQYKDIRSGNNSQQNAGGNLGYVALSFPVSPKWNIGISLKPYSFVDFENTSTRNVPGTPYNAIYYTSGKGGLNKASITNAYQIGKYLSLGLESSYFFGNIRNASEVLLPLGTAPYYLVGISERTVFSDFAFRGGFAVRVPIKKNNKLNLNIGASYSYKADLSARRTTTYDVSQDSFVASSDTLTKNVKGYITLPTQYQAGVSLEWPYKLIISADYASQSWTEYRGFDRTSAGLKNIGRVNVGVEYLPRFLSLNYFDLVRYRIGFSTGKTPYTINNQDVNDTNVSLGFTFPMGRGYQNLISIAFVGGQRGTAGPGLVRERYGRAVLGITLMERWFQKQKLD